MHCCTGYIGVEARPPWGILLDIKLSLFLGQLEYHYLIEVRSVVLDERLLM